MPFLPVQGENTMNATWAGSAHQRKFNLFASTGVAQLRNWRFGLVGWADKNSASG